MSRPVYYPLGGCGDMSEGERMALEAMDEEGSEDTAELEEQAAFDRHCGVVYE